MRKRKVASLRKAVKSMTMDSERFEEYLLLLSEHYTAEELCTELELDVWDIIEMFRDRLEERPISLEKYRFD